MEKDKEVKIDKMVLNIEGEKINLTLEQAKKLKELLNGIFGKTEIIHHHDNYWWYRPYLQPYYQQPLQPYNLCQNTAAGVNALNFCATSNALEVTL